MALLQQLPGQHLAVEDVAAGDAEALLELARAEHQAVDDPVGQVRAGLGEAGDGGVGRGLSCVHVRREALAEQRDDVLPGRREAVVGAVWQAASIQGAAAGRPARASAAAASRSASE